MKAVKLFLVVMMSHYLGFGQQKPEEMLLELYKDNQYKEVVRKADSLLLHKHSGNRARFYQIKADALYFLNDVESSLQNYLLTISNLSDYNIDTVYLIESYSHTGFCYVYLGKFAEALPYYEKALKIAKQANDSAEISTQSSQLGNIYTNLNKLETAEKYYKQSYEISFVLQDTVALAYDLMDLGALMFKMGDYEKAISFYQRGIKVRATKAENHNTYIKRLKKLADAYLKNEQVDSADNCISKAIFLSKEIKDSLSLHKSWLVKANIYLMQEKVDSALLLAERCRNYFTGNAFSKFEVNANITLVKSQIAIGNDAVAINILDDFVPRLKANEQLEALSVMFILRSQINENLNRPTMALQDLKVSKAYRDSLNLSQRENTILSLSKIYDTRDKEQQIALLQSKTVLQEVTAENERRFRIILIFAVLLLLVLAGFLYNQYQVKRRNSTLLKDKNQALKELNHTKDQLFAIVSHDLRNPVSAFRNMTEALEQNYNKLPHSKIISYLKKMKLNAAEIESQLNDLLAWASQEIGKQKIKTQLLPIEPMIAQVFNLLQPIAEIKEVKLEYDLDEHCQLNTHSELFKTVIRNLINNAIKFTRKGGLVKLIAHKTDGKLVFLIEDNGVGIAEDQLKFLFSENGMKATKDSGMGMGLSLTKEIMERLEGEIAVESILNQGTTFTLKFAA